jgi:hypothetical protein
MFAQSSGVWSREPRRLSTHLCMVFVQRAKSSAGQFEVEELHAHLYLRQSYDPEV